MKIIPRTITHGDLTKLHRAPSVLSVFSCWDLRSLTKKLILLALMGFYTYLIYHYFFIVTTEGLANESETPSNDSSFANASDMLGQLDTMKSKNANITPVPTEEPTTPALSYEESMKEMTQSTPDPLCTKTDCDYISEVLDKGVNLDPSGVYFKDGKRDCTYAKCESIRNVAKNMSPIGDSGKYFMSSEGSVFTFDGKKV